MPEEARLKALEATVTEMRTERKADNAWLRSELGDIKTALLGSVEPGADEGLVPKVRRVDAETEEIKSEIRSAKRTLFGGMIAFLGLALERAWDRLF